MMRARRGAWCGHFALLFRSRLARLTELGSGSVLVPPQTHKTTTTTQSAIAPS